MESGFRDIFGSQEDGFVSIVRVGLAETKNFADGYDAIFSGKTAAKKKAAKPTKKIAQKAKASKPIKKAKKKK